MDMNLGIGRVNTTNNTPASSSQLAQFSKLLSSGDYRGGADYARSQGYSDQQIADYTGQAGLKDGGGNALTTGITSSYLQGYDGPQAAQQGVQKPNTPQVDTAYKKNPFLDQMAAGITSQMNDNWTRNQLPSMRSGAMASGGFGGSRQGVVEANGLNDMNRSLGQNLTNLYGTDYTQAQNRNLQQQSINNSYDLGLRSNDLGFAGLDANIANSNFSNQMQAANFGMNAYNTMNNQTATGITAGTNIQNTPLDYQKYFTGSASGVGSGFGNTTTSTTQQGNPYASAIGGALMGNQIYNGYKG